MNTPATKEFLLISRGRWDADAAPHDLQRAIDAFYVWLDEHVRAGRMRRGQRLARDGRTVARRRPITDGPFGETKEVIGGYWFILAGSLDEAAALAAGSPCLAYGLFYEIRPIDPERASAFAITTESASARSPA